LSITVVQILFNKLTCLFYKKRNRLKARVVIYAYQVHVRLLSPEPLVVMQPKSTRVEEPTLLCNHVELGVGKFPEHLEHSEVKFHSEMETGGNSAMRFRWDFYSFCSRRRLC